jgi:DNA polymerase
MTTLHLDFETRSAVDLKVVGAYNYTRHASTRSILMGYAFNDSKIKMWEPHEEPFPQEVRDALADPKVMVAAWNASFERNVLKHKHDIWVDYSRWVDPMVLARYLSMPGSLDRVGEILDIDYEYRKKDGDDLKTLFTEPRPIKARKQASDENALFPISPLEDRIIPVSFADWTTHPKEWAEFIEYCRQDVKAERHLGQLMGHFALPENEIRLWILDQKINDAGMPTDRRFVNCALDLAVEDKNKQLDRLKVITGLSNSNSPKQFLDWARKHGYPSNSLRKGQVVATLADPSSSVDAVCREALSIRDKSAKTSYTKLFKIKDALSDDDMLREQFLFMGAARTGRWSGQAVQLQNFSRPIKAVKKLKDLEVARELILARDFEGLEKRFGSALDVVTSAMRSGFVAPDGYKLSICDYSGIEVRVGGWIAGDEKILDECRKNKDTYLAFAALMHRVPYEVLWDGRETVETEEKRQIAKPGKLGCMYRMGPGDLKKNKYGDMVRTGLWGYAQAMGVDMTREQCVASVSAFRSEYKQIRDVWYRAEEAVLRCVESGGVHEIGPTGKIWCDRRRRKDGSIIIRIHLPSGRYLHFLNSGSEVKEMEGDSGPYSKLTFFYDGIRQENKTWGRIHSHGGRIFEQITQAVARDVLADGMLKLDEIGMSIRGIFHDEILCVSSDTEDAFNWRDMRSIMRQTPLWADENLILDAAGFDGTFYRKA